MSLCALLAALALTPSLQDEGVIDAKYTVTPQAVEVGEPFALVLDLEHDPNTGVFALLTDDLTLDDSWVVFDERTEAPRVIAEDVRITRRVWRIASLEPGLRMLSDALPPLPGVRRVDASATAIEVLGVLAEGEDLARPVHGLPDGFGSAPAAGVMSPWRWAALAVAVVLWTALLVLLWRRLRGRKTEAPVAVVPIERLAALELTAAAGASDASVVRTSHFELTRLVREATEAALAGTGLGEPEPGAPERGKADPGGLTDQEWLASVGDSARLPGDVREDLGALFERAEEVKYAGEVPTSWALGEAFATARRTLETLTRTTVGGGA